MTHNEATAYVTAGSVISARGGAATQGGVRTAGRLPGAPVLAFGPVAAAMTDSGARAFSGSKAMPAHPEGPMASTSAVWTPSKMRKGTGVKQDVYTDRCVGFGCGCVGGCDVSVFAGGRGVQTPHPLPIPPLSHLAASARQTPPPAPWA